MSNYNRGAVLHYVIESRLNLSLRFFIKSRSCLIKNKYLRTPNDSPSNGDALFLSTRQLASTNSTVPRKSFVKFNVFQSLFTLIYVTFLGNKFTFFFFSFHHFFQLLLIIFVFVFSDQSFKSVFVLRESFQQRFTTFFDLIFNIRLQGNEFIGIANISCFNHL